MFKNQGTISTEVITWPTAMAMISLSLVIDCLPWASIIHPGIAPVKAEVKVKWGT